jgi:hypothetical protein
VIGEDDDVAYAPESGQPSGGRDNPWDDDDEAGAAGPGHAFPADHHEAPGDDL